MKRLIPALLMAASFGVAAQAYPTKPIRIVASYPPGGTNDFVARSVGQKLSEMLGQQVLVDNRSGAGGNIGADSVAKAAPDGYTLFMAAGAHALAPSLYKKLSYDLVKDFAHISIASQAAFVLVVNPSVPANNAKELNQYIKGQPGGVNYAVTGIGVPTHLAGEMFKSLARLRMTPVAYKGETQQMTDLLGGHIESSFNSVGNALPQIQAGKVRALAVIAPARSKPLPDVPTFAELGIPGMTNGGWFGFLAPVGTPQAIVDKVAADIKTILQDPAVAQAIRERGVEPIGSSPREFSQLIERDVQLQTRTLAEFNFKIE